MYRFVCEIVHNNVNILFYLFKKIPSKTIRAENWKDFGWCGIFDELSQENTSPYRPIIYYKCPWCWTHSVCMSCRRSRLPTLLLSTILFDLIELFLFIFYSRNFYEHRQKMIAAFLLFSSLAAMTTTLLEVLKINKALHLREQRPSLLICVLTFHFH